jgi:hypothetical protein
MHWAALYCYISLHIDLCKKIDTRHCKIFRLKKRSAICTQSAGILACKCTYCNMFITYEFSDTYVK